MANESTTATLVGSINTSVIRKVMSNYAIDPVTALPRMRIEPIAGEGTATAAFTTVTKASAAAITEGTGLSNTALTTAKTTVAISEVGILRQVTKLGARTNVMGEAGVYEWIINDGYKLCMEKFDTDAWAQWANASTSVGTSGANFTLANFAAGVSQLTINKADGPYVALLSSFQARDLRSAVAASSAPILQALGFDQVAMRTGVNGYLGAPMGVPTYTSNLAAAASSDKVGVFMVDGYLKPENAATGVALGWMPEPEVVGTPALPGRQIAVTVAYGMAEISDFNYCKAVTIGS